MSDKKEERKQTLRETIDTFKTNFDKVVEQSKTDLKIDDMALDDESLRTPSLHQKYMHMLAQEAKNLKEMYSVKDQVYLERWKYWSGKQSDKYYAQYGVVHEKIMKGDIDKYLKADEILLLVDEAIAVQKETVNYLEKVVKEVSNRGFHIKAAIEWRKFENGG